MKALLVMCFAKSHHLLLPSVDSSSCRDSEKGKQTFFILQHFTGLAAPVSPLELYHRRTKRDETRWSNQILTLDKEMNRAAMKITITQQMVTLSRAIHLLWNRYVKGTAFLLWIDLYA